MNIIISFMELRGTYMNEIKKPHTRSTVFPCP